MRTLVATTPTMVGPVRHPYAEETDQRDDLARRREEPREHPALTRREREERWPVG